MRFAPTPRARERRPVTSREGPGIVTSREGPGIVASRPVRGELVASGLFSEGAPCH